MSKVVRRRFGRAFKLALVRRMEAGESGSALAREFGIKRTILYRWRDAVRHGGEEALRDGPGRPVVMAHVRFPLSLRNAEDLLFERGIDICHERVRHWWNKFGPMFAADIRRRRVCRIPVAVRDRPI